MGVRFGSQFSDVLVNALPANSTPTLVYQAPPLIIAVDNAIVQLGYFISLVPGTGTTRLDITLYRGPSVSFGAVFTAPWSTTVVANNFYTISTSYLDQPGGGSTAYSLFVTQIGATVAGVMYDGCILAFVL